MWASANLFTLSHAGRPSSFVLDPVPSPQKVPAHQLLGVRRVDYELSPCVQRVWDDIQLAAVRNLSTTRPVSTLLELSYSTINTKSAEMYS